jgi:uridine kinase
VRSRLIVRFMFCQIGTAAAAFMSVRILLDHGVREDHIVIVTFLVAREGGVSVLRRAFPGVKIVCGAVDDGMKEGWLEGYKGEGNFEGEGRKVWIMQPGMGQIGVYISFRRSEPF